MLWLKREKLRICCEMKLKNDGKDFAQVRKKRTIEKIKEKGEKCRNEHETAGFNNTIAVRR